MELCAGGNPDYIRIPETRQREKKTGTMGVWDGTELGLLFTNEQRGVVGGTRGKDFMVS